MERADGAHLADGETASGDLERAGSEAVAGDGERSCLQEGPAGEGVVAGQLERSASLLDEVARAGHLPAVGQGVGAMENDGRVVLDVAGDRAAEPALTDLQGTAFDGCEAG